MDITSTDQPASSLAEDLLKCSAAIASFLGVNKRRADYLLETGQLPAFKIGGRWHMRQSTFLQHIEKLEAKPSSKAAE